MGAIDVINIAFVIDRIWAGNGGTERQLLRLIKHLDRSKFRPHLICLRSTDWLESAELSAPVHVLGLTSLKSRQAFRAFRGFKAYCRQNDIDIVQTFFQDANLFGTIAAYLCGVKIIISSRRSYGRGSWHTRLWLLTLRALSKITTHYICNSTIVAEYTISHEKVDRKKVSVICNGLELDRFKNLRTELRLGQRRRMGIDSDRILIGAVANLRPIKNLTLFAEVAGEIHLKYPNTRFIIIGEGPERTQLERIIADNNLTDVFSLEGLQDDVLPFLAALDIGVLCSKSESQSNSIIEYMVSGLAVVASDVGGNKETIGEKFGLLFKNDDKKDFFRRLEVLINDDESRVKLGHGAHKYALAKYGLKQSILQHELLYMRCYGEH